MSSSLQEQLVQAGLAEEERSNKARKRRKNRTAGRTKAREASSGQPANKRAGAAGGAERPAPDKAGPRPERTAEEQADRLRQIIRANRIDRTYAGVPYRFTRGSSIREIAVTGTQQARIARGELAVVSDGERCELVPAKTARRIRGSDPQAVLVLNSGHERPAGDADDPYADYPVPDDLMW
mgnify:CR=1 FL=1